MCSSPRRRRTAAAAFSLLEVMVVLVIIGLVAGLVTINVVGQLKSAKRGTAEAQIANIREAVRAFYLENGRYPTNDEGLDALTQPSEKTGEALMVGVPTDPWGNRYDYLSPGLNGAEFEIISYGADGQEGGEGDNADVVSSELEGRQDA